MQCWEWESGGFRSGLDVTFLPKWSRVNGIKAALKTDVPADFLKISLEIPWVYAF